jgi:hypothetical protein
MRFTFALSTLVLGVSAADVTSGQGQEVTQPNQGYACGKGLAPCPNNMFCRKLDNACIDLKNEGNCIGTCQPRDITNLGGILGNNGAPAPLPQNAPRPLVQSQPPRGPQQGGASVGSAFGNAVANSVVTPITIKQCPSSVRCNMNEVCVPHPRTVNAYVCANADEECGTWRNKKCSAGKACLADPRYTWYEVQSAVWTVDDANVICSQQGTCSGRDGVCVTPPP